jgi:hypothetical protein
LSAYLSDARTNTPNFCNIEQATELCQRKFPQKSRLARRIIYLTIGGLFRPDHREKLGSIELIDASLSLI